MQTQRFAVVILAAGASRRLGRPKQCLRLGNRTLLDRAIEAANGVGASQVVVVLGASAEIVREECRLEACLIVENARWQEGISSSIRVGISSLVPQDGVLLMTCDMPLVREQHLRKLVANGVLTASRYKKQLGVPAYFPSAYFYALAQLQDDGGAKSMLHNAAGVPLDGFHIDIDTEEDFKRFREHS